MNEQPFAPERFKVLAFDGGPSATIMLRVLRYLEEWSPGFLEQVDMFSGTSNGAIASLYLAHALNQGASAAQAIEGCIAFEGELLRLFKMSLKRFLRLSSLSLSMLDGQTVREFFRAHFGDTCLGDLKSPMASVTTFNATRWRRRSFHSFGDVQMAELSLVDVAQASSAFIPFLPSFRSGRDGDGELLFDGALTENSTMLSALSDALVFLCGQGTGGNSLEAHRGYLKDSFRFLPRIQMLSLGAWTSHTQGMPSNPLIHRLFKMKWPPLGLQKEANSFEYGAFWVLAANLLAGVALVDRQATDHDMLLRKLLGYERFRRLGATMPSIKYGRDMMLNTERLTRDALHHASSLWQDEILRYKGLPVPGTLTAEESIQEKDFCFLRWIQDCWMEPPAAG